MIRSLTIKYVINLCLGVMLTASAHAAIAPRHANMQDLQSMVDFVGQYQKLAETLDSIDFKNTTVHFNGKCTAVFERKDNFIFNFKGPMPPLEFKHSNCALEYERRPTAS